MRRIMPELVPGKYRVKYDLGIHKKAGLSSNRLPCRLKAGSDVEIQKVRYLRYSVWGKIKDGWILLYMNQTFYIQI